MEWLSRVNWTDVLAIIILLRSIYVGSQRGFFGELFYIFVFCFSMLSSIHFYSTISNFINKYLFLPMNISDFISFVVILLLIYSIFRKGYLLLQKVIKIEVVSTINKIGGPLLGFCKGLVICTIMFLVLLVTPIDYIVYSAKTRSLFGPFFIKTGAIFYRESLNMLSASGAKDIEALLSGARPIEFEIFHLRRKDSLDNILK